MSDVRQGLANYERLRALLAGGRPIPEDLQAWLLNALHGFESGADLTAALGLRLKHGHRYNGGALVRRAKMERALIQVADLIGPRNGATANKIARALSGEIGHVPSIAIDFLWRARRMHREQMPSSRNAITQILRGETRAALYGLTR